MELHKEIKRVRKEHGMNQKDFAERLGMSRGHYNGIETGKRSVTLDILKKIDAETGKQLVITFIDRI